MTVESPKLLSSAALLLPRVRGEKPTVTRTVDQEPGPARPTEGETELTWKRAHPDTHGMQAHTRRPGGLSEASRPMF